MKCIKYGGLVFRVPNQVADALVAQGYIYVPRSEWRDGGRLGFADLEPFLRKP